MTQRPWMPLYIADYLQDTKGLSLEQHGAYLLLIMHYWTRGQLPDDEKQLRQILALNGWSNQRRWLGICSAIAPLFGPNWTHKRIDRELEKAMNISNKRAVAGKKGRDVQLAYPQHSPAGRSGQTPRTLHKERDIATLNSEPRTTNMLKPEELIASPDLVKLIEEQNRKRGMPPSSSATALPTGAPPRTATETPYVNGKAPHRTTKEELETLYADKGRQSTPKVV